MAVKIYKPITPGLRDKTGYTFEEITKSKPERSLIVFRKRTGGRNNLGRVTVRHRGGGVRRFIRIIDVKRDKTNKWPADRQEFDIWIADIESDE